MEEKNALYREQAVKKNNKKAKLWRSLKSIGCPGLGEGRGVWEDVQGSAVPPHDAVMGVCVCC